MKTIIHAFHAPSTAFNVLMQAAQIVSLGSFKKMESVVSVWWIAFCVPMQMNAKCVTMAFTLIMDKANVYYCLMELVLSLNLMAKKLNVLEDVNHAQQLMNVTNVKMVIMKIIIFV